MNRWSLAAVLGGLVVWVSLVAVLVSGDLPSWLRGLASEEEPSSVLVRVGNDIVEIGGVRKPDAADKSDLQRWAEAEEAQTQREEQRLSAVETLFVQEYAETTMAMLEENVFFGTPGFDRANAIISDGSGRYYLAGASNTQYGTYGWIQSYQKHQADETNINLPIQQPAIFSSTLIFDVLRLPDGDLIAVGSGLPKEQAALPESQQKEDGWVARVTPEGQTIWSQRFASERHERFYFVTTRPDGTLLVGGRSETNKSTGLSNGVSYIVDPETGKHLQRRMWGIEGVRRGGFYDGVALPDGGYVLVGWATKPGSDKDDVWIVAASPEHTEDWSKTWGGGGDDLGYRGILDDLGTITVFGWGTEKLHKHTSGLVMRLNKNGQILKTAFLNVGKSGDDKFLSGIQLPGGDYVVAGEASLSAKKFRGTAWIVKLDQKFKKLDERHFSIRGSRFLGLATNPDDVVVATGYGISPEGKQVDVLITEIGTNVE